MSKLIINADDFGYTKAVTYGILEAHKMGVVTSTTALTVSNYFEESMELVRKTPSLNPGVHLTLTLKGAKPVRKDVPSLIDEKGYFHSKETFLKYIDLEEVYKEWDSQIIRFYNTGIQPSHLDSHHNVHGANENLLKVALKLAQKYHLPLRKASRSKETASLDGLFGTVKCTDCLITTFFNKNATKENLYNILDRISKNEGTYEINCHPAYIDYELSGLSSYVDPRLEEYHLLTDKETKKQIQDMNIELINYSCIKG